MEDEPARKPNTAIFMVAGLAIAIGLAALMFALTPGSSESPASNAAEIAVSVPHAPDPASPQRYSIVSADPGVKATTLAELPKAPPRDDDSDEGVCDAYHAAPESPGARAAAAKGWMIAGEGRLGPLTAVTIVADFEPGTSSVCFAKGGNIAFFAGERLVGLIYGTDGDTVVGGFQTIGDRLRVGTGTPAPPFGDLTLSDHAIRFGPLAASDSVCDGRRTVPNIYGHTITAARAKLIAAGWKPRASAEDGLDFRATAFRKAGAVEVDSCAGTGYGQCGFDYEAGRDQLGVGTVGDEPEQVTGYSVECGK